MIIFRLPTTLKHRRAEWMLAIIMFGIGHVYLFDNALFTLPNYSTMARVMPQEAWAVLALVVGFVRLSALYINGAWRPSPHFRALGSGLSCFVWLTLFLGALTADLIGATIVIWPVFLVFDAAAAMDATMDARVADDRARQTKTSAVKHEPGSY